MNRGDAFRDHNFISFMIKIVIVLFILLLGIEAGCPCQAKKKNQSGRSALCILNEDNNSGVKGIVTIHQ